MLKILIVEGNVKALRDKAAKEGSLAQSELYQKTLTALADDLICTIVYPADENAVLPQQSELADFDGIVWTGSALNIYRRSPAVDRQVDFMKQAFREKTRIFGSCWGLEVAAVAAGGEVAANAKGREVGIARDIRITEEGLCHPMYRGKPPAFDAVAIHLDHVVQLPAGSKVLSGNEMSQVQAIEIKQRESLFWGVQYHPEFDLEYIAGLIRRYNKTLIKEGIRKDEAAVEMWAADLETAHHDEDGNDLKRQYCLGSDVLDPGSRLLELSNWLSYLRQGKTKANTAK
ncbi:MAG: type 1 glutamine amidotransferase [Alphaproteobacteria bacterium]|nr:MAG: type 1 glutamine amidotransferase [Alphaproteobacteria bacterium]